MVPMVTPPAAPVPKKRTLYDILGVGTDANAIDIGIAHKARVRDLQRSASADPNEINLVHEAYHVLCLPDERAAYDAKLLSMAEKAAAMAGAQSPDFVLDADEAEGAPPIWKNKVVLAGAAVVVLLAAFWALRPSEKPAPRVVEQREFSPPGTTPAAPAPAPAALVARSGEDLFAELSQSIARITVYDVSGRAVALGSGVVTGTGAVVTNCHVATAGGTLTVKVGAEQYSASVEIADEEYDLCRLSVRGLTAPAVTIGSAQTLKTGQKVYAIGAPQGLALTISDGIVSAMRDLPQGRVIQTTAPISPGSSGGPLFDVYGRLVGIMTFRHRAGQNLNFAVPADWIAQMRGRAATHPLLETMANSAAGS
jgi:S1-C subfamily serine protease